MYDQFLLAKSAGYDKSRVLLLDNGETISFNKGIIQEEHELITTGDVFIDGSSVGVVDSDVIKEHVSKNYCE